MIRDTFDLFGDPDRNRFGDRSPVTDTDPTFDVVLHHETDAAVKISLDGYEARAQWLPKSRIEIFRGSLTTTAARQSGQRVVLPIITVTVPEKMAIEKGLL